MDHNEYFRFENKFRGSKENVLNRLEQYRKLVELIFIKSRYATSLDIGCGRGEWLGFCKSIGFKSLGIENNEIMVKECRKAGFDVKEGDALDLIKNIPSDSLSLVTAFHVIEHLTFNYLKELLSECNRVLATGGILLLETPSIDNISVSTKLFYTDPTHINPINPDSFIYFLNNVGFDASKYFYINGGPLQESNPAYLTRLLNGIAQDICIIATKDLSATELYFSNNSNWSDRLNLGISTIEGSLEFDAAINKKDMVMREKIIENQVEIFTLEQKLLILEKRILTVETLNNQLNQIQLWKKIIRKIPLIYRVLKKIKRILSFATMKILLIKFFSDTRLGFLLFRIMIRFLRKIQLISCAEKYQNIYIQLRKSYNSDNKVKCDNYLEKHYYLNPQAKSIYNDLRS